METLGRRVRALALACCLAAVLGASGCRGPLWNVTIGVRATDVVVAAALGDTTVDDPHGIAADDVPEIPYPRSLRPCCAFGAGLKVELGRVPVPGVEVANLLGPEQRGPHRYDNGFLSLQRADPRGVLGDEQNGLVYTCRGGFIDLAHVRDNADNTLGIAAAVARTLEAGTTLELPPQGAAMRVRVRPIPEDAVARYGRIQLAVALAQWLAYQLSIWHEIATFYGYASIAAWPEKISAFSPEDLYSNQLGVRIAGGVILAKEARSDIEYGLSVDAWIDRALERLGAVPLADSEAAMNALDGAWWDSQKRVPDWTLVRRRQFQAGPFLAPWRLEDASPGTRGPVAPLARCRDAAAPLVFHVHDGYAGAPFRDYAAVEFDVADALVAAGLPLPRSGSRHLTQEDLPGLVQAVRRATVEAIGPGADAP